MIALTSLLLLGRHIPVTDANKFEYITAMTEYKLVERVKAQMEAFKSGLYEIIPLGDIHDEYYIYDMMHV
jgi:HECT-domain (ubiquitin-transferase)